MAALRYRITSFRPGTKGARWAKRVTWNQQGLSLAKRSKKIMEGQPSKETIVAALREAERHGTDFKKIEAMERRLAQERRGFIKLKKDLGRHIAEGDRLGEKTGDLRIASQQALESIQMADILLAEFTTLWADHPETKRLVGQIKAQPPAKKKAQ